MSLRSFIKERQTIKTSLIQEESDVLGLNKDVLLEEYHQGSQKADGCGIPQLAPTFAWKRTFQNCFTGYPNDGKTLFTLFLMVVKSIRSGWKFIIWSPEMKSANFVNGQVVVNYNDLVNEIIWILSGKTPYKHISEKYRCERLELDEYMGCMEFVNKHFVFLDPKNKKADDIYTLLTRVYEEQGFDAVLIDPFKNIEQDINKRDDIWLEQLFAKFKDFAIRTNTVMNWIAHPKANVQRIKTVQGESVLMPCDQFMLNGGAAWNNSMDGIYSVFRPDLLTDIRSTTVNFLTLKQRKQELVCERGNYQYINFDPKTRRYFFEGIDVV